VTGPDGSPVAGAHVQVCPYAGGACLWRGTTDFQGFYAAGGLPAGQYRVKAYPTAAWSLRPGPGGPLTLPENGSLSGQDIVLRSYHSMPASITLTPSRTASIPVPLVNWNRPLALTVQGCAGGSASYQLTQFGAIMRSGSMAENAPGQYQAAFASLAPNSGDAEGRITLQCPAEVTPLTDTTFDFDLYIQPAFTVLSLPGSPVAGATVTLLAYDATTGSFSPVPAGDAAMAPLNRANPDTTDAGGNFGWDVTEGFYMIRAEKTGCTAARNPAQSYSESDILVVPPLTVTDLSLYLDCGEKRLYLPAIQR
jgi:hypothetical protein